VKRFDKRNKEDFARDIKFGTMLEQFWMRKCLPEIITNNIYKNFIKICCNGVDNTGSFQEKSNSAADFMVHTASEQHPLEVKWAPTKGKITLKMYDLISYEKQKADILLIYNGSSTSLKKPKNTEYSDHWELIQKHIEEIRWGIITNTSISSILKLKPQTIFYMGNKPGYIIPESDFPKYFELRRFS
jgi:hypothetical protein